MNPDAVDAVMALASVVGASFFLGVGFACWRAVGWAERIREWARTVDVPIADRDLEGLGQE